MRVVIYARISEDHERAESVPTQIANGTSYAERMGWDMVRVFKDEGRSGYTGEVRPRLRGYVELPRQRAGCCNSARKVPPVCPPNWLK